MNVHRLSDTCYSTLIAKMSEIFWVLIGERYLPSSLLVCVWFSVYRLEGGLWTLETPINAESRLITVGDEEVDGAIVQRLRDAITPLRVFTS